MNKYHNQHCTAADAPGAVASQTVFRQRRTAAAVHKALLCGVVVGTVAIHGVPAHAQAADQAQENGGGKDGAVTLSTVTVKGDASMPDYSGGQVTTGGRMGFLGDKDFMETPFSTITYTEKFIADQQAQDISAIISKTDPTVFASNIPGESLESYKIRGLPSDVGDVTINGLAGMAGYYRSSPDMIERVEVLKGPSALLNGMPPKGSAGGAVNLVTKRAGNTPLTRVTGSYLSDAQFGTHVDLGRRFGENQQFGIRFNGSYRQGEANVKRQDKNASQFSLGLDWRGDAVRLSADVYQSHERVKGLSRGLTLGKGVSVPNPPNPEVSWNPPWAFYDVTDTGVMARGEFDLSPQWTVYAAAGVSNTELDSNMGAGELINSAGDFKINFSGVADRMERQSAEVGVKGQATTGSVGHQFALNVTHYTEDYRLNGFRNLLPQPWITNIYHPVWGPEVARPANIARLTKTETRLNSIGMADTLSFAKDKVQLTLGVRYQNVVSNGFNGATGARTSSYEANALTPSVALVTKLTDKVSVYANYIEGLSQGARAPENTANEGEVFAPFKTKQKEVGVKFDLGEFAHTVSLYEIKRPSSYTDPATKLFSFGGEQRNRGVEWGFFGSAAKGVRLMGGVAYSDPKVTKAATPAYTGQQAIGAPKWQAKVGGEWDVSAMQGLTVTANATATSRQYVNAENTLSIPGHTVYDIGARYGTTVSGYPLTLRMAVANIANKAYWAKPHFTSLGLGAGRSVMLSATVDF